MKKKFNPQEWLPKTNHQKPKPSSPPSQAGQQKTTSSPPFQGGVAGFAGRGGSRTATSSKDTIELYISEIEKKSIDISGDYTTWRNLAFSLADEYGEPGREYFHRISRFHPGYNHKECDAQYTSCLKANGTGITIATFFHHAKAAGIQIHKDYSVVRKPHTQGNIESHNDRSPVLVETHDPVSPTNNIQSQIHEHPINQSTNSPINEVDPEEQEDEPEEIMPTFPDSLYEKLPVFLQRVAQPAATPEERDMMLLGAITSLSACFQKIYGIYLRRKVYSNLFLFVTAPASAGKGNLSLCKNIVQPIHRLMREKAKMLKLQYANELAEYNTDKNGGRDKPVRPPERMLFIPANNSNTGVFQLLADNKGRGLIFETEGDTLTNSFKSEHGNFSDGLRKSFHHEAITYYRRIDKEYVDIENPCLSTVLSGTPKQVTALIPSSENGLFSRFLYYCMNLNIEWQDVFEDSDSEGIDQHYLDLGEEFLDFYKTLNQNAPIKITFTKEQGKGFNNFFRNSQNRYLSVQSKDFIATSRRMGLIAYRLAMVFTALRIMEDGDVNPVREIEQEDYESVITMAEVLLKHSSRVFNSLPEEAAPPKKSNRKERFLESLPARFDRPGYNKIAADLKIVQKTAERYITEFVKKGLIHRDSFGKYLNSSKRGNEETEESEESEEDSDESSADSANSSVSS